MNCSARIKTTVRRIAAAAIAILSISVIAAPEAEAKKTLRILAVGNSFSDDAMEYLPALLESTGIDNVELARLYVGGCTLKQHLEFHIGGESRYEFYRSAAGGNRWVKSEERVSLRDALSLGDWDIITLQQASGYSGRYESYHPHLDALIGIIRAAQPGAKLAWHMTWAYSTDSTHGQFADYGRDQIRMYEAICSAVRDLMRHSQAFYTIIPSGTAIQSLRLSGINNPPKDLTRDGYHMDYGAGRFALACVWYETLIRPFVRKPMRGDTLRIEKGEVHVDGRAAALCRKAARKAVKKRFTPQRIKCRNK